MSYDLTIEERAALSGRFLSAYPPVGDNRYPCYQIDGNSAFANIGRSVEGEVFLKTFGNDAQTMEPAYGPYESASHFFVSFDQETRKPVGVLRVIKPSAAGLMTLNDLERGLKTSSGKQVRIPIKDVLRFHAIDDPKDCWDIATIAVLFGYRRGSGTASALQLYRAAYMTAVAREARHLVSMIDKDPYTKMTRVLGMPFRPLAGSPMVKYLDSDKTQPVYGQVTEFRPKMERRRRLLRLIGKDIVGPLDRLMDGEGIDDSYQFKWDEEPIGGKLPTPR